MNVLFFADTEPWAVDIISRCFAGITLCGDSCRVLPTADIEGVDDWADIVVNVGIRNYSRLIQETYVEAGKHFLILDEGYFGDGYIRASIDALQPHAYFQMYQRPDDRLKPFNIKLSPSRRARNIVVVSSSPKYAIWHGFNAKHGRDPLSSWGAMIVQKIQSRTNINVVYRPHPLQPNVPSSLPVQISRRNLQEELMDAWAVVTYGSRVEIPAIIAGVPIFVMEDGIGRSLSKNLRYINDPLYPSDEQRINFLSNVTYVQWTLGELENGTAWSMIRRQIEYVESLPKVVSEK